MRRVCRYKYLKQRGGSTLRICNEGASVTSWLGPYILSCDANDVSPPANLNYRASFYPTLMELHHVNP